MSDCLQRSGARGPGAFIKHLNVEASVADLIIPELEDDYFSEIAAQQGKISRLAYDPSLT